MSKIKEILKKYKEGKCTVKEQMLVRICTCLFVILVLCILSAIMDFLVWFYPYKDSIIFLATIGVAIYEVHIYCGIYIFGHMVV